MQDTAAESFEGEFYRGEGDAGYIELLDIARRMFAPDPQFQNVAMLYSPVWNGFVEGPTWGAWWIQNSYGPTYCALPFYVEPYTTFLQNAQDLWFNLMGDGQRKGDRGFVAPDGCLCDAATPTTIYYRQGDGRVDIHDWGMEFTAAGLLMQSELLLISRDTDALGRYLPKLERSANFIETRRDPKNNLFLAGPAGNLLAPSYAGWKKPDGTYDKAYLTGLSVTYIAALDRLIELEKLAGNADKVALYTERRGLAQKGLAEVTEAEGYFIRSLDPDGTRHGVYGAAKHGYFEASPNHDAICFRVVDDAQAERIYAKIASIPGLRPHDFILPNCPGYDDMYEEPTSWLWQFGTWVNGGHWSTCEARAVMAYYHLGQYEDVRKSMKQLMTFANDFRMDNPLVDFGSKVYQPKEPINICYDTFGPSAAAIRGLFEYIYTADGLKLIPHIPIGITQLEQRFPIRFGTKNIYLSTIGNGDITAVSINGAPWKSFDKKSVSLPYDQTPDTAQIQIAMAGSEIPALPTLGTPSPSSATPPAGDPFWNITGYVAQTVGNTLPLRIGADSEGQNRFLGDMWHARIFNRALAKEEIAALAQDPEAKPAADAALVADWALGDVKDGAIVNTAGKGLAAKIVGDLKTAETGEGPGLRFAGEGFVEVAHNARLALSDAYTLEAWICPKALPATGARIIDKVKAGIDNGYLLDTCPGNALRFITENGTVSCDAKLEPGKWYHVAATFDAEKGLSLYLNGKLVAEAPPGKSRAPVSFARVGDFYTRLNDAGLGDSYEAQHAKLIVEYIRTIHTRKKLQDEGKLKALPEPSQSAANKSYVEALNRLAEGFQKTLDTYKDSEDAHKKQVFALWKSSGKK